MWINLSRATQIGKMIVERGTTGRGYIDVMKTPTRMIQIPIVVVSGAREGPTLCLIAGDYGRDYNGFVAISDLLQGLQPNSLAGKLIAVPFVNLPALEDKADFSIIDVRSPNLNRCFPGDPKGSPNTRLVHVLFTEVISKCDFFILLEAGGGTEHHLGNVSYTIVGDPRIDSLSEEMARHFVTADFLYRRPIDPRTNPPTNFVTGVASKGIPAIITDLGGESAEIDNAAVTRFKEGVLNIMKYLKMIDGEARRTEQKELLERSRIQVGHSGIFRPRVNAGDLVSENQVLGEVLDVQGNILEILRSPIRGIVQIVLCTGPMHRMLPTVNQGSNVIDVTTFK